MKFCFLIFLLFNANIFASYRVFQLKVISYDEKNKPRKPRTVLSSLDPDQYENYYGGFGRMRIQLVDTWFCPGDTSGKEYCKKPKDKRLQRGPAGVFAPQRTEGSMRKNN